MNHSYEEIRKIAIEILAGKININYSPDQYANLKQDIAEAFQQDNNKNTQINYGYYNRPSLSDHDENIFLEVFWDLFRQGIITLGLNDANPDFPFFRVSELGKKIIENQETYFFHDGSSYEKIIKEQIPNIDETTLIYLKEAMQAFFSGCILSSSVMLGVASEHLFYILLETIESNTKWQPIFKNVFEQKTILQKLNKFKNILEQQQKDLLPEIKEDLETNFSGIIMIIRNFRNESGHPSGKFISREQSFVNLQLLIPYGKKIYQLISFFK